MNSHLTDAQLSEMLSTTPQPHATMAQAHLADCPACQEELAGLEQSLAHFRLAATSYSLLHTPPRPIFNATGRRGFGSVTNFVWATGLASVLAVTAVTLSTVHKAHPALPTHVTIAAAAHPVSDEALLQDIDSDLSTSVPPSLQPLDTTTTASEPTPTATSN